MADNFRYKYGDTSPVLSKPVVKATEIAIGDLVTSTPGPASGVAWNASLAGTQEDFHDVFLGVASQRSRDVDEKAVRVSTRGVFEFDCDSDTYNIGQLVGAAKATGNALESQKVAKVATAALAVGRVVQQYDAATTKVKVEIVSTVGHGGPQAPE